MNIRELTITHTQIPTGAVDLNNLQAMNEFDAYIVFKELQTGDDMQAVKFNMAMTKNKAKRFLENKGGLAFKRGLTTYNLLKFGSIAEEHTEGADENIQ